MFPIMLDLSSLPVLLVGNGPQAARRLGLLDEDLAHCVTVYAPAPSEALAKAAGTRLARRLLGLAAVADSQPPPVAVAQVQGEARRHLGRTPLAG